MKFHWRRRADSSIALTEPMVNHIEDISRMDTTSNNDPAPPITPEVSSVTSSELAIDKLKTGLYIWIVILILCIGGLLYGFDTGSIGGVIADIEDGLGHPLSTKEKEIIISMTFVGATVGCVIPAFTASRFGRRCAVWIGCSLYCLAGVIQVTAKRLPPLIAGRIFAGMSLGSISTAVPTFIAELAPAKWRGVMQAIWTEAVVTGQFGSYGIVKGFADIPQGWRYMLGLPITCAVSLGIGLFFVPEPPQRQLSLGPDYDSEVFSFYSRSFPDATDCGIHEKMNAVRDTRQNTGPQISPWKRLVNSPQARRKLGLACFLTIASQFTGFNSLMFYSTTLLKTMGFKNAELMALPIAATNVIGTTLFMLIVRFAGRRNLTLSTLPCIIISCIVFAFSWPQLNVEYRGFPANPDAEIKWPANLIYTFMIVFVFSYSLAIGNIAWAASELFPTEVRSHGAMIMTGSNWVSNIIISATFLTQFQNTGPAATYGFYGGVNFVSFVVMIYVYPETQGMQLEQISSIFEHDFGVRRAKEWQAERREERRRERNRDDVV